MADACAGAQRDCQPRHPTRRLATRGDLSDVARAEPHRQGNPITNDVVVLDIYRNIATVRVISPNFVDYLHLAKLDGQ